MATTDAKPGFRLPWSADRSESETHAAMTGEAPIGEAVTETPTPQQEIENPDMIDAAPSAHDQMAAVDEGTAVESTHQDSPAVESTHEDSPAVGSAQADDPSPAEGSDGSATGRKPNRFMAELTKAMQGAAETAKAETLARFSADAKAHIESIHAATAVEATELRKQADDDVASIREWSKAEIARIREETDERITHRKARLEREIEAHAADIEARIERVQRRVDAFEAEMADFFKRLIAEEDATRFAAMAESLPEPPPFDDLGSGEFEAQAEAETVNAEDAVNAADAVAAEDAVSAEVDELPAERAVVVEPWPETPAEGVAETFDNAESTEAVVEGTVTDETPVSETADTTESEGDPRLDALGLTPDFDAAEAEAAAFTPEDAPTEDEIPVIGDDALAARLAGLVPDAENATSDALTTRVVVTGLVSVASIAGFKRQLSRVVGVQSVGVSSGPDGEFLFSVNHDAGIVLRDAVTTLPGFGARVTAEAEGELTVTAKDPETEG